MHFLQMSNTKYILRLITALNFPFQGSLLVTGIEDTIDNYKM